MVIGFQSVALKLTRNRTQIDDSVTFLTTVSINDYLDSVVVAKRFNTPVIW